MSTYEFFLTHPNVKTIVNEKEYENSVGLTTPSGYYKNGWIAKKIEGKKGKYSYIQMNIYTSAGGQIDIEEKWLIRNDGKIMKRLGWHNVNLLNMSPQSYHKNDLKTLMDRFDDDDTEYVDLDDIPELKKK